MLLKKTPEEHDEIITEEIQVFSPMWLAQLADALGCLAPFASNQVNFGTVDSVERAVIRIATIMVSFEDMLRLDRGTLLSRMAEIYPSVAEIAETMPGAANMIWQEQRQE